MPMHGEVVRYERPSSCHFHESVGTRGCEETPAYALDSPVAWNFLLRFPTQEKLRRAQEHTLIAFLKGHNLGKSAHWEAKLKRRADATQWPTHPQENVESMYACGLVEQLKALQSVLRRFRHEIEEAFEKLPQAAIFGSLPGVGPKLQPRLAAIVGSGVVQEGGLDAVRGHSVTAPVTEAIGKHVYVYIRRICNKNWRNTLHRFAWCSTRASTWAKAFYQYRRAKGDTHSSALRKLADKWLHIIMRIIETNEPYDKQRYLDVLPVDNSVDSSTKNA